MTTCQQRVLFLGPKGGSYTDLTELPKEKSPKHLDVVFSTFFVPRKN
jgi:hypothetical protein